jgi:nicotinamide mononucleotide transporter
MSVLSVVALISGALGVWLTIRQTIWCWPVALISVVASIAEFYNERLYGDMSLQVVYFFAGIYGWIYWNQNKNKAFIVARADKKQVPLLIGVTVIQSAVYYFLLQYFKGDRPFLDAILTACSLTATYMMTKKWVENWLFWVFIDGTYVLLYGLKEMWLFVILNVLFTVMAFYGWLKWRRTAS